MFFKSHKKEEIIILFDIGSASVGAMLISKQEGKNPEILLTQRRNIKLLSRLDQHIFSYSLEQAFRKLLEDIKKNSNLRPTKALCVFSSLQYFSQTRVTKVKRDKPYKITEKFLHRLVHDEMEIFKRTHSDFSRHSIFFEKEIMKAVLNGYETKNPYNKEAKTLELYTYISIGRQSMAERIKEIIYEQLGSFPIYFRTLPYLAYRVMQNLLDAKKGFLFIDVAGEVTEISLVLNDVLEEVISFPIGKNFLLRDIAKNSQTFIEGAPSLLEAVQRGDAKRETVLKVEEAKEKMMEKWSEMFKQVVSEIKEKALLPENIFFIADNFLVEDMSDILKSDFFSNFTSLGKPFNVQKISPKFLKDHFDFKRGFDKDKDSFLMMEALYSTRFL